VLVESSEAEEEVNLGAAVSDPDDVGEYRGIPLGKTGSKSHSKLSRNPKNELLSAEDKRSEAGSSGGENPGPVSIEGRGLSIARLTVKSA